MFNVTDDNRKWWVLTALGTGAGLIMLDETVIGVALPTIRHDLGMTEIAAHWTVSIYLLVFAGLAAAAGKIGDLIGFRVLFTAGTALFGAASFLCGWAQTAEILLLARAIQGLGAAIIFPASVAMLSLVFPKEQRGMAIGILAATGTVFLAAGPLIGGALTDALSWRWVFWINAPITVIIISIISLSWVLPKNTTEGRPFDIRGFILMIFGLSLIVFALMQGASWGWTQIYIMSALICGALSLAVFYVIERRSEQPLIDVRLFHAASFSSANLILFAGQFSKLSLVVFGALFLQDKLNMSPFQSGLALLVCVAAFPVLSIPVGRLADHFDARNLVLGGLAFATLGMFSVAIATVAQSYLSLLPGLIIWGLGMPFCYAPTLRAMANSVPPEKQGEVSGVGVTSRLLGGTLGVALSSTVLMISGEFQSVFYLAAWVMLGALIFGWLAFDKSGKPKNT
ncbi:MFS transporter [Sneathiella marina]|uniref:MFS transporter n=1 Tax=Sneathiella marina TaxID=2950108 RepID=A0ABY4VZK2_9PROT|nr:MFS transporter [Sneathiella marina]USG60328.1 MFS transporter [Sneathiella marina]